MLKKKVDGLEEYYYQWMNKYKDDADRRLELLRAALEFIDGISLAEAELRMAIEKELADAKK